MRSKLAKKIQMRCSDEEVALWSATAASLGLSLSAFIRMAVNNPIQTAEILGVPERPAPYQWATVQGMQVGIVA